MAELDSLQQQELSQFYWETDVSTSELKKHYDLTKPVHHYIAPLPTGSLCPSCGGVLVFRSRAKRQALEEECLACRHTSRSIYICQCDHCRRLKKEEDLRRQQEGDRKRLEQFEAHVAETSSEEYVRWALSKTGRRERIFLQAFLQVVQESEQPTWQAVCDRAKVVSHRSYLDRLLKLGLLHSHPTKGVSANPALRADLIEIEPARRVSKSERFDVFQRDKHTCQYCGRRPPEVELELDHLIAVARGGTDDFGNLVTSCRDCNSGKSAKLIQTFTGGYARDAWRDILKQRREQALALRRQDLQDIIDHWASCRKQGSISSYDREAVHRFIEIYEPEWIKDAIQLAVLRSPSNYVKYVAGILRNWARNGRPTDALRADAALDRKKATPKQIEYIDALLAKIHLQLSDFYFKDSLDELTMLDARNIIHELTRPPTNDDGA